MKKQDTFSCKIVCGTTKVGKEFNTRFEDFLMEDVFYHLGCVWCLDRSTLNITESRTGFKIEPEVYSKRGKLAPEVTVANARNVFKLYLDSHEEKLLPRVNENRYGDIDLYLLMSL